MNEYRILWVDDEIEVMKPHILFLRDKGYQVETCTNGTDAIDRIAAEDFEILFLDEHMPGLSGLETLKQIKGLRPNIPVVMITKSEEENIMEKAIGSKIADYLIKPVKPNQIVLSIKKILEKQRLVTERTTDDYQSEFRNISMQISEAGTFEAWAGLHKKLAFWDMELEQSDETGLKEIHRMQENEANQLFSRYVKNNYTDWMKSRSDSRPLLSHDILHQKVFPLLRKGEKVFLILVDNMRYDQWRLMYKEMLPHYRLREETMYCSILPSTTQYARNALFAGMMPLMIERKYPDLWISEEEEHSKNMHEEELLGRNLQNNGLQIKYSYAKVKNMEGGRRIIDKLSELEHNDLVVIVYNFVDMLSHARTEMDMIRELANDEAAYRSLTLSWFRHSELFELIRQLSEKKISLVFTTDHGTVRVNQPVKVVGDKATSANLRYKTGKNLGYKAADVFEIRDPGEAWLPRKNVSSRFIFALNQDYLIYPNNFNYFAKHFRNTFQHGGVSLHEMIIPLAVMDPQT